MSIHPGFYCLLSQFAYYPNVFNTMKRIVDQQHSTLSYFQRHSGVFEFLPNTRCCSGYSSCLTGRVTRFTLARSPARVLGRRFCTFTISTMIIFMIDEDDYHHGSKDQNDGVDGCHRPVSGDIDLAPLLFLPGS